MRVRDAIATFRGHRVPHLNIVGKRNWWFALSGFFIILSLVGLAVRQLNFSIDFTGGSLLEFPNRSGASVERYQGVMARYGLGDAQIEIVGSGTVDIRTQSLTELGLAPATSPTPSATVATPSASASAEATPTAGATPSASPSATPTENASATPTAGVTATPTPTATTGASPSPGPTSGGVFPTPKGDRLRQELARTAGISVDGINEQDVGPTWGNTISRKALTGLIIFLVAVSLYISFRFEPKMAGAALIALLHDLIITAGIYVLVGREVTPETVIAILTILGYSLYDTVVIFDKVKENAESAAMVARDTYSGVVNTSLNQTLMRSVNTSLVVLFPIGALLLFGGQTLKDFAFALFIGVASGAYSSIFIAAPILAFFKEREPRYQQIRARAQARAARPGLRAVPRPAVQDAFVEDRELEAVGTGAGAATGGGAGSTRPRSGSGSKKKKSKPQGKPKRRRR